MTPGSNASGMNVEAGDPNRVIAGVLDSLRQSRGLLLDPSPRNVDCCRVAVAQCTQTVGKLAADRAGWDRGQLTASLLLVRCELGAITELLDSAAVFRRDMLKAISDASRHAAPIALAARSDQFMPIDSHANQSADQKVPRVHVLG
jgi:hypothetical protein